jgi:colanic acid/amylovoran biosynthesis glycosyltransferase
MHLAVFTAEFPGRINTFFARDMCALIRAGVEIDIFPIHPLRPQFWSAVPAYLSADVLPRDRVHHIHPLAGFSPSTRSPWRKRLRYLADTATVRASALRFGPEVLIKSEYACLKAWGWATATATATASANDANDRYDHVLAYWGNYAATAAYLFHRLLDREVPLSILWHAHDLYERQAFLRQKLLCADNLLVVCDFNRRFLQTRFPDLFPRIADKIHVHHLGLDVQATAPTFDGRAPHTCLAVGRLDPSKGFDDLLRAAAIVIHRGLNLEVELAGDGEEAKSLRRLAASLGIADRVHFLGWLPYDAVPDAMRRATMLVHPSCGLGDAVPTVIKEAMALGTPVIGSTAVGIPELLDQGRCGLLVPEREPERLADAIALLLRRADLRDDLARSGRAFAERTFDLWRNGQCLADLLRATRRGARGVASATESPMRMRA